MEINAVTLVTDDMAASVAFWGVLDAEVTYGGPDADFTTLRVGSNFINLVVSEGPSPGFWGRVILHVASPDELHTAFAAAGYPSMTEPADAPWGERYFQILDPAGHEISFARPLEARTDHAEVADGAPA